ncbi:MAG: hypothetical protein ACREJC_04995 [Tepidisphaeraceae bacterium]
MTRAATGDTVFLPPSNNVYTVLVIAGFLVQVIGLAIIYLRATKLGVALF